MILWINGSFGSGKTQAAYELEKRLDNAVVFDPERIGFYIQRNLPKGTKKGDFQDYKMWREMNYSMLSYMAEHYEGTIICPMTITNKTYKEEIIDELAKNNIEVNHVTLMASQETIVKRLKGRGEKKNAWCFDQVERCCTALSDDAFAHHLVTDHIGISEVVEAIALKFNLNIEKDTRSKLRKKLDRLIVWKRNI